MPNDSDVRPPPRRRLPLRYLFSAFVALLVVPIGGWLVWGWIEAGRLDRALDAIEARHEPLNPAAFDPTPTTPEQRDASHLYARAGRLVDERPITIEQAAALSKAIETVCSPRIDTAMRQAQERLLVDFEQSYGEVIDLLERASQLDANGWDDSDRPARHSMQEMRPITLARVNVVRIARLACTGQGDAGARALLASLRLRRVWIGSQIGPITMQTAHSLQSLLTLTTPALSLLEQLRTEYTTAADETRFQNWMLRERAVWLSYVLPGTFNDLSPGDTPWRMTPPEAIARRVVRPLHDHRLVDELEEFDAAIALAKQPWPAKLDAVAEFGKTRLASHSQSIQPGLFERLSRPLGAHFASNALTGYINGMTETLARNRVHAAAIAVAEYRRAHNGLCPENLEQVAAQPLSGPVTDPYSGAALKYRCDAGEYTVYSVGANRKDDGGTWEQHSDLQLSRRGNPPDVGMKVMYPGATTK